MSKQPNQSQKSEQPSPPLENEQEEPGKQEHYERVTEEARPNIEIITDTHDDIEPIRQLLQNPAYEEWRLSSEGRDASKRLAQYKNVIIEGGELEGFPYHEFGNTILKLADEIGSTKALEFIEQVASQKEERQARQRVSLQIHGMGDEELTQLREIIRSGGEITDVIENRVKIAVLNDIEPQLIEDEVDKLLIEREQQRREEEKRQAELEVQDRLSSLQNRMFEKELDPDGPEWKLFDQIRASFDEEGASHSVMDLIEKLETIL